MDIFEILLVFYLIRKIFDFLDKAIIFDNDEETELEKNVEVKK